MQSLTLDRAHLLFTLFLAQNADKKIRDFVVANGFPSIDLDITLGSLEVVFGEDYFYVHYFGANVFWYDSSNGFVEINHFNEHNVWKPFDIMNYVSLEDKI